LLSVENAAAACAAVAHTTNACPVQRPGGAGGRQGEGWVRVG